MENTQRWIIKRSCRFAFLFLHTALSTIIHKKELFFHSSLSFLFFLFYGSCCNSSLVLLSVTDYTAFPLFPTLHSGKSPGRSALIQERNRLRRRSVIRVGNNNTGL